jgi:hypothetical protein
MVGSYCPRTHTINTFCHSPPPLRLVRLRQLRVFPPTSHVFLCATVSRYTKTSTYVEVKQLNAKTARKRRTK